MGHGPFFGRASVMFVVFLAMLIPLVAGIPQAEAAICTESWTGAAGDGSWQTPANWSTGAVPGGGDYACVVSTSAQTISFAGSSAIRGLSFTGPGTLSIQSGTLTLSAKQASTISNLVMSGDLVGRSSLTLGTLLWYDGTLGMKRATLTGGGFVKELGMPDTLSTLAKNTGVLDQRAPLHIPGNLENSGKILMKAGLIVDGDVTNSGTITSSGPELTVGGDFTNSGSASIISVVVSGDFTQASQGGLFMKPWEGSLSVGGTANLDGSFELLRCCGSFGTQYQVVSAGSRVGQFAHLTGFGRWHGHKYVLDLYNAYGLVVGYYQPRVWVPSGEWFCDFLPYPCTWTLRGSGFFADETVDLSYEVTDGVLVLDLPVTVQADANGAFAVTVTTEEWEGDHHEVPWWNVYATGESSGLIAEYDYP